MPPTSNSTPPPSRTVVARERRSRLWLYIPVLCLLGTACLCWAFGLTPRVAWENLHAWYMGTPDFPTLVLDRGEVSVLVVESGTVESANNTTVKCEVEALLGVVGGQNQQGQPGASGGQSAGAQSNTATPGTTTGATPGTAAGSATTKSATGSGSGAATKSGSGSGSASGSGATGSGGGGGSGGAAPAMGGASSGGLAVPQIQSFTYVVAPYVPLRGAATKASTANTGQTKQAGQGGGRGGGGGGGGQNPMSQEQAGSTRILSILDEGTWVEAGDIVCQLDSSRFDDELKVQEIRYSQAKSYVEQAQAMLEVNKITLREYRDGILPKDRLQVQNYIASCHTLLEKAGSDLEWSRGVFNQGLRSPAQLKADEFALERAKLQLDEASRMQERLDKFTAPRIITNIEAKIAMIRADVLAQQATFQRESDRLKRIERMIANCTIRAPRDGIVVYANQSNPWSGRTDVAIKEGATVRQGQPIFNLPDPSRMRVQARVNESKVALIQLGMKALITVDAFPEQPLYGTVSAMTAIPAPAAGPISDVKIYFVFVEIKDSGFEGLRPGMSAEVAFQLSRENDVTRIPLQAVRRIGEAAFAAVPDRTGYQWRSIEVGARGSSYAEVRSGLEPGEKVIADPQDLPAPEVREPVRAVTWAVP